MSDQPPYGQPPYGQQPYGQQQPPYGAQPQFGAPPDNHLAWGIVTTLLCCFPLGVASIVFASQVNSKYATGDFAGALESSRRAKQFAIWSAIATGIVVVLGIVFVIIVGATSSSTSP